MLRCVCGDDDDDDDDDGLQYSLAPGVPTEPLYRRAAPPESARIHTPPAPRSHPCPACAAACTAERDTDHI